MYQLYWLALEISAGTVLVDSSEASGSSAHLDDDWQDLVKVVYVLGTFGRGHPLSPEPLDPLHQLIFGSWPDLGSEVVLQLVPHHLNGVEVWALWRGLPPVDVVFFKEGLGKATASTKEDTCFNILLVHNITCKNVYQYFFS